MAPHDDLTAERAAIQSFYYCLHAGVEGGEFQERYEQEDIGKVVALVRKTRQEALREAARVICPYCAAPDRWSAMNEYGDHESRETKPSRNGSLRPCSAQPILDRLASEGG